MTYRDLRDFIQQLESSGQLRRIAEPVSPHLEMTAVCDHTLRRGGPALLFTRPTGHQLPVLGNLFGTPQRVMQAMGVQELAQVRELGSVLAGMKEPSAPQGLREMIGMSGLLKSLWHMAPRTVSHPPCQQIVQAVIFRDRVVRPRGSADRERAEHARRLHRHHPERGRDLVAVRLRGDFDV